MENNNIYDEVEPILKHLWRDGYHAAAKLIEDLVADNKKLMEQLILRNDELLRLRNEAKQKPIADEIEAPSAVTVLTCFHRTPYGEIMKEHEAEMTVENKEIPLDEMNILEMVDYFMEQGMTEEQANDLAHAEWKARDVRQRGNDVVRQEKLDALYAENPIGDDDWFYHHPDRMAFEAVYFNPDSNAGGQYVIMTLPYELISNAVEQTNEVDSFFEFLEERASYTELVDITDEDFRATMENYKNRPADFIGRSAEVMTSLITTVANEVEDPVLLCFSCDGHEGEKTVVSEVCKNYKEN